MISQLMNEMHEEAVAKAVIGPLGLVARVDVDITCEGKSYGINTIWVSRWREVLCPETVVALSEYANDLGWLQEDGRLTVAGAAAADKAHEMERYDD